MSITEIDRNLIRDALHLYTDKTRKELSERKSWVRQPNNLISVVAIVLSLLSIFYQMRKDHNDSVAKATQSLLAAISSLSDLEREVALANANGTGGAIARYAQNKRFVLLAQASQLIAQLGSNTPTAQLYILGSPYEELQDFDNAIKYLRYMTLPSMPKIHQLGGWRSIGNDYFLQGPTSWENGRDAFRRAAHIFDPPRNDGEIFTTVEVYEQWAAAELRYQNYAMAAQETLEVGHLAVRLSCTPGRTNAMSWVAETTRAIRANLPPSDAAAGKLLDQTSTEIAASTRCSS